MLDDLILAFLAEKFGKKKTHTLAKYEFKAAKGDMVPYFKISHQGVTINIIASKDGGVSGAYGVAAVKDHPKYGPSTWAKPINMVSVKSDGATFTRV